MTTQAYDDFLAGQRERAALYDQVGIARHEGINAARAEHDSTVEMMKVYQTPEFAGYKVLGVIVVVVTLFLYTFFIGNDESKRPFWWLVSAAIVAALVGGYVFVRKHGAMHVGYML